MEQRGGLAPRRAEQALLEAVPCDLRSQWGKKLATPRSGEKVTAGRGSSKCQGPEAGKVSALAERRDAGRGGRVVNEAEKPRSYCFLQTVERSLGFLLPIVKPPWLSVTTFFFFYVFLFIIWLPWALAASCRSFCCDTQTLPLWCGAVASCRMWTWLFCGLWDLRSRPGIEPTSPVWQGRCLTTGLPGSPH